MILFIPIAYAGTPTTVNPDDWKPSNFDGNDMDEVVDEAGIIVSVIRTFGIIVSVVVLLIMGIRYMMGSVEEKAEYKKTMIPYLIGAFMLFGITIILGIFSTIITGITDNI